MKLAKQLVVVTIACVSLFLMSEASFASPQKPSVRIDNRTGKTVIYKLKWGGDWKEHSLEAGHYVDHSRRYDPKGVPDPQIMVRTAGGIDGGTYTKPTRLDWGPRQPRGGYYFDIVNNKVGVFKG